MWMVLFEIPVPSRCSSGRHWRVGQGSRASGFSNSSGSFLHEGLDSLKSSTREGVCRVSQNPKHAKTLDCVRKNGAGGSEARSIDGSLAVMRSLEKRLQSWASGEPRSCRALDVEA